ncbi:hypothetical protein LWI28_015164 [Acer negundo]|uniref:Aminotransferase-like plant mobile domain-containing protein n=1 Tax=Acer negundo TaxID=4023 RepID=A0AAD5NVT8_ACENE|nr:hypothetical protein LWI28_015164 [Acer negundo]
MEEFEDFGFVEREELMISPSGEGEPTFRSAHFLQPTVTSIDGPVFEIPNHCISSIPPTFEPKNWPLEATLFWALQFFRVSKEELKRIEQKLNQAKKELNRSASKKASYGQWMKKFMGTGLDFEHEAFLALWLSSFVFPVSSPVIVEAVFPIAIHMSRGTRIALAPPILASIYRDLVQIWAWERFIEFRPKANLINIGEPRCAQWHKQNTGVGNVRTVLDSARVSFDWRPYVKTLKNWKLPEFYAEKEMCVWVDADLPEEFGSFALCLRTSELVGIDCVEHYLPHRVAMQFGMDQDLPACVARANDAPHVVWSCYCKPITCEKLYIRPQLFEAVVTT